MEWQRTRSEHRQEKESRSLGTVEGRSKGSTTPSHDPSFPLPVGKTEGRWKEVRELTNWSTMYLKERVKTETTPIQVDRQKDRDKARRGLDGGGRGIEDPV